MAALACDERGIEPWPTSPAPPSGSLNTAFGSGGIVTSDPSTGPDIVRALVSDGTYMFIVGSDEGSGLGDSQWRIEKRLHSDGSFDTGFGSAGVVLSNPSAGIDSPATAVRDSTYLYLGGLDESSGNRQWRIEKRRLLDGALDTGFGTSGVVTTNPSAGPDEITAMLIDSTNLYIIGFDESPGAGDRQWRCEKRTLLNGTLVTGFGSNGVLVSNPSSGVDSPAAVVGDSVMMYVGGFDDALGNRQWRVEARRLTDSSLDSGFALSGVLISNPSSGNDEIRALHLNIGDLWLAGIDESPGAGDTQWRVEKRSQSSGALDTSFAVSGILGVNPSTGPDAPTAIGAGSTTLVLVGTDYGPGSGIGDSQWRVENRNPSTGALDLNFAQAGVLTSNPSPGVDQPINGPVYFVGTQDLLGNARWRMESRYP